MLIINKIKNHISLKIFMVILLFMLLQGVILYWVYSGQLRQTLIIDKKDRIKSLIVGLQENLQYLSVKNELGQVHKVITSLGAEMHINKAILFDENHIILASTNIESIGEDVNNVLSKELRLIVNKNILNIRNNLKNIIIQSRDGGAMYALSPIVLGRLTPDSIRSDKIGIIILHYDMTWIDIKNQRMLESVFIPIMLLFSVAGIFLAIYFDLSIVRRIKAVAIFANQISKSDYKEYISVVGNDEISNLGRAFNAMAQKVRFQRDELVNREKNLLITLNSIGDAVITTDKNSLITRMNPISEKLTGWKNDESIGHQLLDVFNIINAQTRKASVNPVEQVLRSRRMTTLTNHTILISKDKTEYQIADSASPIMDESDEILGVILVFRDVTEQYKVEEALRRSQKMDAIGKLSGGIAHDFNNQLGIIMGYLDMISDCFLETEKPYKWVQTATKASVRCADLTRQLLSFSRKQKTDKVTINLNDAFNDLQQMISRSVTPEIDVEYVFAENLMNTETNIGEFQDAIINLVINSRDAMVSGGKIVIETNNKYYEEDFVTNNFTVTRGYYVQLTLSDTGSGISENLLEHIFEPFFTTKESGKGTGLGLSMVYGFIKRYDGFINIYSEPGVGTCFSLNLPASQKSESDNKEEEDVKQAPRGEEKILIVEDEIHLLELAECFLSELGYQTKTACNGPKALDILTNNKFDLIFSDVIMPEGMNGYELAQQAVKLQPEIKVLLTSGFTGKFTMSESTQHLTNHLLSKPYHKFELAQFVRRLLDE